VCRGLQSLGSCCAAAAKHAPGPAGLLLLVCMSACRVLVNGYALNHTALSVHQVKGHSGDIYSFANHTGHEGL